MPFSIRQSLCFNESAGVFEPMRFIAAILLFLAIAAPLRAQKQQREPLTEAQADQIANAGGDPDARIKLYTKFLDDEATVIRGLTNRLKSPARVHRVDDELQDFTALMDELGSNLDTYSDRHADLRKSLKELTDITPKWHTMLRALPGEAGFDLARKEAIESEEELADQATRLLNEQTEYFRVHKEESGQERAEPK